jgi:hypothetical protein
LSGLTVRDWLTSLILPTFSGIIVFVLTANSSYFSQSPKQYTLYYDIVSKPNLKNENKGIRQFQSINVVSIFNRNADDLSEFQILIPDVDKNAYFIKPSDEFVTNRFDPVLSTPLGSNISDDGVLKIGIAKMYANANARFAFISTNAFSGLKPIFSDKNNIKLVSVDEIDIKKPVTLWYAIALSVLSASLVLALLTIYRMRVKRTVGTGNA